MIFANKTAADVWQESWCARCFRVEQVKARMGEGRGCPIWDRAMHLRVPPPEMMPSGRDGLMQDAFRCTGFMSQPASVKARASGECLDDEPSLFDEVNA